LFESLFDALDTLFDALLLVERRHYDRKSRYLFAVGLEEEFVPG
jgi:hypothetical protein